MAAGDEEDCSIPEALQRQNGRRRDMVLVGRLAYQPAVDAIHAARDPCNQDAQGKEEAGPQVRSLDGILDDKLGHGPVGC